MALTFSGVTTFKQSGPERWSRDGWGLDHLSVPYDGPIAALPAFKAGLTMWAPSSIDSDMFLHSWSNDNHKRYTGFDLLFIGKKGGVLPSVRQDSSTTLQHISYTVAITGVASATIDVQYLAPTTTASWISRSPNEGGDADAPSGDPKIVFWRIGSNTSANVSSLVQTSDVKSFLDRVLPRVIIPSYRSEELVPGQYYQNTKTKTLLYEQ